MTGSVGLPTGRNRDEGACPRSSASTPNLTCTPQPANQPPDPDSRLTHEVDPDFLEFVRREEIEEPEPTWEP